MKIVLILYSKIAHKEIGGRYLEMENFLKKNGHEVIRLLPEENAVYQKEKNSLSNRILRRLGIKKYLPHYWDWIADKLEVKIKREGFDIAIATSPQLANVLIKRDLTCIKIYDMDNFGYLEGYYAGRPEPIVEKDCELELDLFKKMDFIFIPYAMIPFIEKFIPKFIEFGRDKLVPFKGGCNIPVRTAKFSEPVKIVYAGGGDHFIHDPFLLSYLTSVSTYKIDAYGMNDQNRRYFPKKINYKGFRNDKDFLSEYQFGLITISKDTLRQYSISSKFPDYMSFGLPVLFPEWMREGYNYEGCIPYNEDNFVEVVEKHANRQTWYEMSKASLEQAKELTWDKVLQPILEIIQQ